MGEEGENIEFSSWNDTMVMWNMDDYPIPVGMDDFGAIRINIEEALDRFGFHGDKRVSVHCKHLECDMEEALSVGGILYLPSSTLTFLTSTHVDRVTTMDMTSTLAKYALTCLDRDFAVIAKPNRELVRVLKCLALRGVTVLLIDPPDEECSFSVESLLGYAHRVLGASEEEEDLSQGSKQDSSSVDHLSQGEEEFIEDLSDIEEDLFQGEEYVEEEDPSYVEEEDLYSYPYTSDVEEEEYVEEEYVEEEEEYVEQEEEEDTSKILDFLEPIRPVKSDMTAVFWDAVDCPFPLGSTPDEIYHSIASALVEREFTANITIWAYLDEDDDKKGSWRDVLLGNKTWASRIYFLPGGDKDSRRIRMANDILFLWEKGRPESLILVSDQFRADRCYLELFYHLSLPFVFIHPTQDINNPESPEWPRLLIDEGHHHFATKFWETSDEPCPKKRKANAEAELPAGFLIDVAMLEAMDYGRLCEPLPAGPLMGGRACYPLDDETSQSSEGSALAGLCS